MILRNREPLGRQILVSTEIENGTVERPRSAKIVLNLNSPTHFVGRADCRRLCGNPSSPSRAPPKRSLNLPESEPRPTCRGTEAKSRLDPEIRRPDESGNSAQDSPRRGDPLALTVRFAFVRGIGQDHRCPPASSVFEASGESSLWASSYPLLPLYSSPRGRRCPPRRMREDSLVRRRVEQDPHPAAGRPTSPGGRGGTT